MPKPSCQHRWDSWLSEELRESPFVRGNSNIPSTVKTLRIEHQGLGSAGDPCEADVITVASREEGCLLERLVRHPFEQLRSRPNGLQM